METSDCAFRFYNNKNPKTAAGRLMVHLRNTELNLLNGTSGALLSSFVEQLRLVNSSFMAGQFKLYRFPVVFMNAFASVNIPENLEMLKESNVTCIEFEAYGDTVEKTMTNLDTLFLGLLVASQEVNGWIPLIDEYSIMAATGRDVFQSIFSKEKIHE